MKISKTMRFTVKVRDYENVSVEVGAEANHYDFGVDDAALIKLSLKGQENLRERISTLVEEEVDRLLTTELQAIASWAEIHPNLADDYLKS